MRQPTRRSNVRAPLWCRTIVRTQIGSTDNCTTKISAEIGGQLAKRQYCFLWGIDSPLASLGGKRLPCKKGRRPKLTDHHKIGEEIIFFEILIVTVTPSRTFTGPLGGHLLLPSKSVDGHDCFDPVAVKCNGTIIHINERWWFRFANIVHFYVVLCQPASYRFTPLNGASSR